MPKRTRDHHAWLLEQLANPAFAAEYVAEARRDSRKEFLKALRNVAEVHRMSAIAEEAGVNRESLYKSLSEDGNPRLATLDSVMAALGMDLIPVQRKAQTTASPISQGQKSFSALTTTITGQISNTGENDYKTISSKVYFFFETQKPVVPEYLLLKSDQNK